MWTNGDEVTADDYVAAFRYTADPKHAWDFRGTTTASSRTSARRPGATVPTSEVGVEAGADKYQVVFTTAKPVPVPAGDAHLVVAAPREGPGEARLRASTTSTRRPPSRAGRSCWRSSARTGAWSRSANPKYTGKLKPHDRPDRQQHRHRRQRLRALPGRRGRLPSRTSRSATSRPSWPTRPSRSSSRSTRATSAPTTCSSTSPRRRSTTRRSGWRSPRRSTARRSSTGILAPMAIPAYSLLDAGLPGRELRRRSSRSRSSIPRPPSSCSPRPASRTGRASRSRR